MLGDCSSRRPGTASTRHGARREPSDWRRVPPEVITRGLRMCWLSCWRTALRATSVHPASSRSYPGRLPVAERGWCGGGGGL